MQYPTVKDLLPAIERSPIPDDTIIRARLISDYGILYSAFGGAIQDFIKAAFVYRANDPFSYVTDVTMKLFQMLFSTEYDLTFNYYIRLNQKTQKQKIKEMMDQGFNLIKFFNSLLRRTKEKTKIEVDAAIQCIQNADPKRTFEIKMYTSPNQSNYILENYLAPNVLGGYLTTRDYLGFITFSTIHDKDNPKKRIKYPTDYEEDKKHEWVLHFCIVDRLILNDDSTTAEAKAKIITNAIHEDQAFFIEKLNLNTLNGSMSLIENFVKVVEMSYQIEELQRELAEEREERRKERAEWKEEQAKWKKEKDELIKYMKKQGIKPPKN